jgi:hypothetical protein
MMMLALVLACSGDAGPAPGDAPREFTLVYQASVDGEIEPCG